MRKLGLAFVLLGFLPFTAAHAYIGPGAGAGTIAIVLGILSSIFLAFVGIIWYPIKRLLKLGKKAPPKKVVQPGPEPHDSARVDGSSRVDRSPPAPGDHR